MNRRLFFGLRPEKEVRDAMDRAFRMQAGPEFGPHPAVAFVSKHVPDGEYVLMWGAETSVNFVSGYRAPTRYVYQYPLYTKGYQTPARIDEFYADLDARRPYVIIDSSATNTSIPPLDPAERAEWSTSDSV